LISQLEKEITLRYLKTRKKNGFINVISIFSFIGISLGVAVLIVVMSVMNGFRSELINKIVGFNAHVIVNSYSDVSSEVNLKNNELKNLSSYILHTNTAQGIILTNNNASGILFRGYDLSNFQKLDVINKNKFTGEKDLKNKGISIGKELSLELNLNIGDKITILSPKGIETLIGKIPKQEVYEIKSIFSSGLYEFDRNVAFLNINDLENLFEIDKSTRSLEIFLKKPENITSAKNKIKSIFKNNIVYTWADLNQSLFSALKVERNVMFIILSLIIIVAAFNIISGLTILVTSKTREIAILKSIGVNNYSIKKIFFLIGLLIGTFATFTGIILGVVVSVNIEKIRIFIGTLFNLKLFPEEIYFLSTLPSEINLQSILLIAFCSIIISTLVSIYPAIKASNLDTIKSLKYE
tara:strand:+ start:896 stop:2125 length:1230 start_codon:yes stop_codon:yes gene_type:complete